MPYIKRERRIEIRDYGSSPETRGELAYLLTLDIERYCRIFVDDAIDYEGLSGIIGTLETLKLEVQRRLVEPYEDGKIKKNGDCYLFENDWFEEK